MAKIYLDAGHGGEDPGAEYKGRNEADDTLKMTLAIGERLEKHGVEIKYARTTDSTKLLMDRTSESNNWGADYYLSVHRNSFDGSASGNEIWVLSTATDSTCKKAQTILDALCAADQLTNRGLKKGAPSYTDFAVNRYTKAPSALLEMGFITSEKDNAMLDSRFNAIADAMTEALCDIVHISYQNKEKTPITSSDARKALRAAARLEELNAKDTATLDTDGDGTVTSKDARELLRRAAGLSDPQKSS